MNDAEYGKHIREQSKKYWVRFKAIQTLRDEAIAKAKIVISEEQIKAQIAKSSK